MVFKVLKGGRDVANEARVTFTVPLLGKPTFDSNLFSITQTQVPHATILIMSPVTSNTNSHFLFYLEWKPLHYHVDIWQR